MENVIISLHTHDSQYLIIWGCVTKINAHKKQWCTVKRRSSAESRALRCLDKKCTYFVARRIGQRDAKSESASSALVDFQYDFAALRLKWLFLFTCKHGSASHTLMWRFEHACHRFVIPAIGDTYSCDTLLPNGIVPGEILEQTVQQTFSWWI
jgi:hypothetical protein